MTELESSAEADLPEPTVPRNYPVELRGFESEEAAHKCAYCLRAVLEAVSRYIDIERLHAVTVAYDLKEALASLDRGTETSKKLAPTDEAFAIGIAMAPAVIRDGAVKACLFLNAGIARSLEDHAGADFKEGLYVVAHECGHIHDLKVRDAAFPGVMLQKKIENHEQGLLEQVIGACWDEYAACYLSAAFATDKVIAGHEEVVLDRLAKTRAEANEAIKGYRLHGDVDRLLVEVAGRYGDLLKFCSYFLGDLDGKGIEPKSRVVFNAAMEGHWFGPYFDRLVTALRAIADKYGDWSDRSEFDVIGSIYRDVLQEGGIELITLPSGLLHIDVPFTAETLPDAEWEQKWHKDEAAGLHSDALAKGTVTHIE